ncbi:MAG: DegT/DnrJ/EryC1/StrS family aminotransferase [Blautia wexlerae]
MTDDEEAANKVRKWSTQARENAAWYRHEELGYNYRMSNVASRSSPWTVPVMLDEHISAEESNL